MTSPTGLSGLEPHNTPPASLQMSVYDTNGIVHVDIDEYLLTGNFDEAEFRRRVDTHIEDHAQPRIVINLKKVESISSRLLGELLAINRHVESRAGQLRLAHLSPLVQEVFAATHLDRKINVCPTVAEAVESFDD